MRHTTANKLARSGSPTPLQARASPAQPAAQLQALCTTTAHLDCLYFSVSRICAPHSAQMPLEYAHPWQYVASGWCSVLLHVLHLAPTLRQHTVGAQRLCQPRRPPRANRLTRSDRACVVVEGGTHPGRFSSSLLTLSLRPPLLCSLLPSFHLSGQASCARAGAVSTRSRLTSLAGATALGRQRRTGFPLCFLAHFAQGIHRRAPAATRRGSYRQGCGSLADEHPRSAKHTGRSTDARQSPLPGTPGGNTVQPGVLAQSGTRTQVVGTRK